MNNDEAVVVIEDLVAALKSRLTIEEQNWPTRKPYEHPLSALDRAEAYLASIESEAHPDLPKRLIAERKFYRSDWPLDKLLEARNGGLVTDEGEAWFYSFSSKDGRKGEYDMLFRRIPQ